jgi:hypothetical protein
MQSITNQEPIRKGARLGKIGTAVGLVMLFVGLLVSLLMSESPLLWLSFVFLILGVLISSIGTMNMNRWVREPRADQALAQGLKGFDDRYRVYHYILPAPHVLLSPNGLTVYTMQGQDGSVRFEDGKFHRAMTLGRVLRFMADEGLGRPLKNGDEQVAALREYLVEHDVETEAPIDNVLVFYNPGVQLDVSDPPRPIVTTKAVKRAIRKKKGAGLSESQQRRLQKLFESEYS